jgi:lysophospholipase L1-like esterase
MENGSMNTMRKPIITLLIVLALAVSLVQCASSAPVFKTGDRVVIYGDSITEQQVYARYMQQYLQCRYPDLKLKFYNAGWGGDTALGALNRLDRDVLFLKPTVVTLFFGMNDGVKGTVKQDIIAEYRSNMQKLIKGLQAKNIRVVVFTPGCVDYDKNTGLGSMKYNEMLETLGANTIELSKQFNCHYVDVFHTMLKYQTAQKAIDPQFTMTPDGVHPNSAGHMLMAYAMLQGMGAEPISDLGEIDMASGVANGLKILSNTASKIVIETTKPVTSPFWFAGENAVVVQNTGLINMIAPELKIRGLSGSYKLSIDGDVVGSYTADQFATGLRILGSYSNKGKQIHDVTMYKESVYYLAWRNMRIPFQSMSTIRQCVKTAGELDDSLCEGIQDMVKPRKAVIVLER